MERRVELGVQGFLNFVKGLEPILGGRAKGVNTQLGHPIKLLWENTAGASSKASLGKHSSGPLGKTAAQLDLRCLRDSLPTQSL